jgi:hypothetical protein
MSAQLGLTAWTLDRSKHTPSPRDMASHLSICICPGQSVVRIGADSRKCPPPLGPVQGSKLPLRLREVA